MFLTQPFFSSDENFTFNFCAIGNIFSSAVYDTLELSYHFKYNQKIIGAIVVLVVPNNKMIKVINLNSYSRMSTLVNFDEDATLKIKLFKLAYFCLKFYQNRKIRVNKI